MKGARVLRPPAESARGSYPPGPKKGGKTGKKKGGKEWAACSPKGGLGLLTKQVGVLSERVGDAPKASSSPIMGKVKKKTPNRNGKGERGKKKKGLTNWTRKLGKPKGPALW